MNESDSSDDVFHVPASKRRRILSSSSESSNDFDYDTELSDTASEDDEEIDEVGPSNVSEEWVLQNAERPPFPFTAHPGKTFTTSSKKILYII